MYDVEFASGSFAEIYQQVNMQFAFCSLEKIDTGTKIKQLHGFIKCRDFLGDALVASNRTTGINIYSFSWSQAVNGKVPQDQTNILIKYADEERLTKQLQLINAIEKNLKWKRSKLINTKKMHSNTPVFLVVSSKKWVSNTVLISLYTMLWRLAGVCQYDGETIEDYLDKCSQGSGSNDQGYLKSIYSSAKTMGLNVNPVVWILKNNAKIFKPAYPEDEINSDAHNIHYNNGIQSLFANTASNYKSESFSGFGRTWQKNVALAIKKDLKCSQ